MVKFCCYCHPERIDVAHQQAIMVEEINRAAERQKEADAARNYTEILRTPFQDWAGAYSTLTGTSVRVIETMQQQQQWERDQMRLQAIDMARRGLLLKGLR